MSVPFSNAVIPVALRGVRGCKPMERPGTVCVINGDMLSVAVAIGVGVDDADGVVVGGEVV